MPKETFFNLENKKQEKVMRAAINEFLEKGFERGNIGNVAKKAGVAKGSMYQYFENKKELFSFSVKWATDFVSGRYSKYEAERDKTINIFDFLYEASRANWIQLKEEREIGIFIQDVFFGKYNSVVDESIDYIIEVSNMYTLKLIREGKENGFVRKDIDDNIILTVMTGASIKFKEDLMKRIRDKGSDIMDSDFESYDKEIKALLELLKNGMGV